MKFRLICGRPEMMTSPRLALAVLCAAWLAVPAAAQAPVARVLFRVFLADGRVLSSYGEWARLDDRVIFSMPTQLTHDPVELHLVSIPSQRVDWPRTEQYAQSVRAAAYSASRGAADYATFSAEMAKVLNDISKTDAPKTRLATAEKARQRLAEWPSTHFGYRVNDVREALATLDEVIAQLRVSAGMTQFDLSLSADTPLEEPPPPPLPPPTDAELVEQFVAAASITESPIERMGLLDTVVRLLDRAIGMLPPEWATRMRRSVTGDLDRERHTEQAYAELRTRTLQTADRLAAKGKAADLERLRDHVKEEDRRLGGQRPGDIAALLATIDLQAATAIETRDAHAEWEKHAAAFRKYRRSTNSSFKVFNDAATALELIKSMNGPSVEAMNALTKRLAQANKTFGKVKPPERLANDHYVIVSAVELAGNAFQLRMEAVSKNRIEVAQRASSAAAGALMLYNQARNQQLAAMEPPAAK